jgi:SAM-dependent methyltransferase
MNRVYHHPKYYEIAFSFRDIRKEVDFMERCMASYSQIPVQNILEVGCGNSPHLIEIASRGYRYIGIDLSPEMIEYSQAKAASIGKTAQVFQANMVDFRLKQQVDFAYVALASLFVSNTAELISHFSSVSRALRPGGLYLLDWCIHFGPPVDHQESWEVEQNGIKVHTEVRLKAVDRIEQTIEELISIGVDDHGKQKKIAGRSIRRVIYPQEFLLLLSCYKKFEFVGWWNNWDLTKPLRGTEKDINRPVTVIRRL